jgi:hypothetical protein
MGLKAKDTHGAAAPVSTAKPPPVNPEVEARLNPYIAATAEQHQRYLTTATDNPERAARLLSLKDLDALEREHRLNKNQIEGAKTWLAQQPADVQERINAKVTEIKHPLMQDMKVLQLVVNRMTFENKVQLGQRTATKIAV